MATSKRRRAGGEANELKTATFAAGCFWGIEDIFMRVKGVKETTVGYTGGRTENPTYMSVSNDETGHAEAVRVKYDPEEVKYEDLLVVFFNAHDPTLDHEAQYRSAIFYHTEDQRKLAEKAKERFRKEYGRPIATGIAKASAFYRAEEHHQKYDQKHGFSCHSANMEKIKHLLKA